MDHYASFETQLMEDNTSITAIEIVVLSSSIFGLFDVEDYDPEL